MKKIMVFAVVGVVILLGSAVVSVGARPDDGLSGGYSYPSGMTIRSNHSAEEAVIDCLNNETSGKLTREELKELRYELALNGNSGSSPAVLVACASLNKVATR